MQVCQLCSTCVCKHHRVLIGDVTLDKNDKPMGGCHSQCDDPNMCNLNQIRVIRLLHARPDQGGKGKGQGKDKNKGKGKRKYEAGKGNIAIAL